MTPRYRIPLSTEIFPYARERGHIGLGRLTTVEVTFTTADRLTTTDPATGEDTVFFCLPLDANPSPFDSYLVRAADVIDI